MFLSQAAVATATPRSRSPLRNRQPLWKKGHAKQQVAPSRRMRHKSRWRCCWQRARRRRKHAFQGGRKCSCRHRRLRRRPKVQTSCLPTAPAAAHELIAWAGSECPTAKAASAEAAAAASALSPTSAAASVQATAALAAVAAAVKAPAMQQTCLCVGMSFPPTGVLKCLSHLPGCLTHVKESTPVGGKDMC